MNNTFSARVIWITSSIILVASIVLDFDCMKNGSSGTICIMTLVALPYVIAIGLIGFIYRFLFEKTDSLNSLVDVFTKLCFMVLMIVLLYQLSYMMLDNITNLVSFSPGNTIITVDLGYRINLLYVLLCSQIGVTLFGLRVFLKSGSRNN